MHAYYPDVTVSDGKKRAEWARAEVQAPVAIVVKDGLPVVTDDLKAEGAVARLLPTQAGQGEPAECLMICSHSEGATRLYVNGLPAYSATALRDRDEISIAGARWYGKLHFSTLTPIVPGPFRDEGESVSCATTKQRIAEGDRAVRCSCGLWFLDTEEMPVWSSRENCINCGRSTTSELAWTPEPIVLPTPTAAETAFAWAAARATMKATGDDTAARRVQGSARNSVSQ